MMNLEQIEEDFKSIIGGFISSSPCFSFDKYQKNKASLFEDLGNQLIYSKPSMVEIKEVSKIKMMNQFVENISVFYNKQVVYEFLEANGTDGFFRNKVTKTIYILLNAKNEIYGIDDADNLETKSLIKIQKGMKLARVFKYFIKEDSGHLLDYIQTKYSQVINGSMLNGDLSLSIHPLDYLSMSHNNQNWRSCQSLDGENAAGTLSLMCDKTTAVAYLASSELEELDWGGVHWNSKKWRVLVHIDKSKNLIVLSKHYPFYSYELESQLVEMIKEIYPQFKDSEIDDLFNSDGVISKVLNAQNYNDISRNGCKAKVLWNQKPFEKILIGSTVACLHCGKEAIQDAMSFACYTCMPVEGTYCDRCQSHVDYIQEDMFWVSQESRCICPSCFDDAYAICDHCSRVVPLNLMSSNQRVCIDCNAENEAAIE